MHFIIVSYFCWGVIIFNLTRYNFIGNSLILTNLLAFLVSCNFLNVAIRWNSPSQRVPLLLYRCQSLAWILSRLRNNACCSSSLGTLPLSLWVKIRITLSLLWPCSLGIIVNGIGFLKKELNWIHSKKPDVGVPATPKISLQTHCS